MRLQARRTAAVCREDTVAVPFEHCGLRPGIAAPGIVDVGVAPRLRHLSGPNLFRGREAEAVHSGMSCADAELSPWKAAPVSAWRLNRRSNDVYDVVA